MGSKAARRYYLFETSFCHCTWGVRWGVPRFVMRIKLVHEALYFLLVLLGALAVGLLMVTYSSESGRGNVTASASSA